ncbi:MAG TPA: TonB-dependent receptor [Bryobacteraceae bacterium]|nr:TonB-dependent receptor [Bryobacteraceae bacterium]
MMRRERPVALLVILGLLLLGTPVAAADQNGVFGLVLDPSGHALPDAKVQVQSNDTGARWSTKTGNSGQYSVAGLAPGEYKVTVRSPGFRTISRVGAVLTPAAGLHLDFSMEIIGLHEVITVVSDREHLDPSIGDSLLVTRSSPGAALPSSGRDYRALFDLMPGTIFTPAGNNDAGQFTSNGQRPNSNIIRVDGVSANTGVGGSALPGSLPGASLPAMSAIGNTENLGTPETAQSVELRVSSFAAENGERPGAGAFVNTRSGTNQFHSEFYGRFRDNGWAARDWFANSLGIPFERPYYDSLGLNIGGPIKRNRTFFFLSGERSTLNDSAIELVSVPAVTARTSASEPLQNLLQAFPLPVGPGLGADQAVGAGPVGVVALVRSASLRIDQALGSHGNLFGRYIESPSNSSGGYYTVNQSTLNWRSGTLGITLGSAATVSDFRLNYSHADLSEGVFQYWSAAAFQVAGLLPTFEYAGGFFSWGPPSPNLTSPIPGLGLPLLGLSIGGLGQFIFGGGNPVQQDQWEVRETFSHQRGRHQFHAGFDYLRLTPSRDFPLGSVLGAAPNLDYLLSGQPLAVTYSQAPQSAGNIHMASLFAQDTFHVSDRLNLVLGVRWELTPPGDAQTQIPTVSGLWNGTDWQTTHSGDINGAGPWPMRFFQFAPRVGMAWRLPVSDFVLRAGAGMFYDTALAAAVNPINGAPFNSWELSGGTGLDPSAGAPYTFPGSPTSPDVLRFLTGSQPGLRLPLSYQWRVSLEKSLGSRGVGSVAYAGSAGRNLLGNEAYVEPGTGILDRMIALTQNSSTYEAMQARYSGRLTRNVYGTVAYSWAHSIDDGSQDSSIFLIHPGYNLNEARASSSFDVRHALTTSLSYHVTGSRLPDWMRNWTVSGIFRARTGFPIDVRDGEQALGLVFDNVGHPNLEPGAPIWLHDPMVAGQRRLNPAAFSTPAAGTFGTLGRNAIAGNGLGQFDASLRREFPLYFGFSLEVSLNVFNVLNHPAFADAAPFLSSPWFGQSTSMQNLMLGMGSPNTGLPPVFQTGGARSIEIGFRVSF